MGGNTVVLYWIFSNLDSYNSTKFASIDFGLLGYDTDDSRDKLSVVTCRLHLVIGASWLHSSSRSKEFTMKLTGKILFLTDDPDLLRRRRIQERWMWDIQVPASPPFTVLV